MASRACFAWSAVSPSGTISSVSASARFTSSTSDGAASSARAIATLSAAPPHSSTRVNSQMRPSETANVERSCPIATATSAAAESPPTPSCGGCSARRSANANGVRELLLVADAGDLEGADTDAVVCDAEADALLRQAVRREEGLQRLRERVRVAQLAADDDARVERGACDLQELGRAVVRDARGRELRSADLEACDALCAAAAARRLDLLRFRRLRRLRFLLLLVLRLLRLLGRTLGLRLLLLLASAEREILLPERHLRLRLERRQLLGGHRRVHTGRGRGNLSGDGVDRSGLVRGVDDRIRLGGGARERGFGRPRRLLRNRLVRYRLGHRRLYIGGFDRRGLGRTGERSFLAPYRFLGAALLLRDLGLGRDDGLGDRHLYVGGFDRRSGAAFVVRELWLVCNGRL